MRYLLIMIFVFIGCTPILKIAYGVKKPSPKSIKKIQKGIEKYELNRHKHLIIDSIGFNSFFLGHFHSNEDSKISISVIDFIVMDSIGVLYNTPNNVCVTAEPDLDSIINIKQYIRKNSYSNFPRFYDINGNPFKLKSKENELVVFITWATHAGKLNKNINEEIEKNVNSISSDKNVYYLNLDMIKTKVFDKAYE